jgi:hypothetical protein
VAAAWWRIHNGRFQIAGKGEEEREGGRLGVFFGVSGDRF